jgi:hypothetical protein
MSEIKLDIPNLVVLVKADPDYRKVIVKPDSNYNLNINVPRLVSQISGSFIQFAETALSSSYALTASYVAGGTISTASYAITASYAENAGGGAGFPYSGSAIITGSLLISGSGLQVIGQGITGSLLGTASIAENITLIRAGNYETGSIQPVTPTSSGTTTFASSSISASYALTSSYVEYTNVANKPTLVSSSTQINTGSFSGSFIGTFVGSASFATTASAATSITFTPSTASFATTASYALNAAGGGGSGVGFPFSGSAVITGSLLISGSGLRVTGSTNILGNFTATTKSFLIDHQALPGKKLVYGVLEGPEHAVFIRGKLQGQNIIVLPDEWIWLVDMSTITIHLTPIGKHQTLFVSSITGNQIIIDNGREITDTVECYYLVHAERKDVLPLQTVI